MPDEVTQKYFFGGFKKVKVYTEQEMAVAMGMSKSQLRPVIESGIFGISYHGNPLNTYNREYTFLEGTYLDNIKKWECVQSGGHFLVFDSYYDERLKKRKLTCPCGYDKYE